MVRTAKVQYQREDGAWVVPLTKGQVALVDEPVDGNWCAHYTSGIKGCYAARRKPGGSGTKEFLHRHVWEKVNGPIPSGKQIDHINHDTQDNRLKNLRLVSIRQNGHNRKDQAAYPGTEYDKRRGRWYAQIMVDGRRRSLGCYSDPEEASCAHQEAAAMAETEEGLEELRMVFRLRDEKAEIHRRRREYAARGQMRSRLSIAG